MAEILKFPAQQKRLALMEKYTGELFKAMLETVDFVRGRRERKLTCASCGIEFLEGSNEKSDRFPSSDFCSVECRGQAEEAAEDNRRTDVRSGSY